MGELLEGRTGIPFCTEISILQDMTGGLVYLHHHRPPVIHRDLSAQNILLNSVKTAKIADLGISQMVDISPGQLAQTVTQGPSETLTYMPPEALCSNPQYGLPLDMFSFGQLTLFTAIQVFPKDLLSSTYDSLLTSQVKEYREL